MSDSLDQPEICYGDEHLLVLYKPNGYFAHPTKLDRLSPDLTSWLKEAHGLKAQAVHRLDRGTSGLMVFSLNLESLRGLSEQFASGQVQKEYQALVRGFVLEGGEIDRPIETERGMQEARTSYRPLSQIEKPWPQGSFTTSRYSLVHLTPHSGRRHQLRRHLSGIHHPILGDSTHGDNKQNRHWALHTGRQRLELFAVKLGFTHPVSGEALSFDWAVDEGLLEILKEES